MLFDSTDNKTPDPTWLPPPETPAPSQPKPWHKNLPSFYTNWSPTSTRKFARPAANWTPVGQPEDPTPTHFNRPSPSDCPAIYRRVMFRPTRSRSTDSPDLPEADLDLHCKATPNNARTHALEVNHSTQNEVNAKTELGCGQQSNECVRPFSPTRPTSPTRPMAQSSTQFESDKSNVLQKEPVTDGVSQPQQARVPCQVPSNGPLVDDDDWGKASWRKDRRAQSVENGTVSATAMVSIPTKPIQRPQPQQAASEAEAPYQECPWRSPLSNRRMFRRLKSPPTTANPPSAHSVQSSHQSTFQSTSEQVVKTQVTTTEHAANPHPSASDKTLRHPSQNPASLTQTSASEHTHSSNKSLFYTSPVPSTSNDVLPQQQQQPPPPPPEQQQKPQPVQQQLFECEKSSCSSQMISSCTSQREQSIREQTEQEAAPTPPPPPPPSRDDSTTANPIQELLANVVRYESVNEAHRQLQQTSHDSSQERDLPDYVQESITNRIQKFEKQASFDADKPKDKPSISAKPVGPWVKKTSTGPVAQGEGWANAEAASQGLADTSDLPVLAAATPTSSQATITSCSNFVREQDPLYSTSAITNQANRSETKQELHLATSNQESHRLSCHLEMAAPSPALTQPPLPIKQGDPLSDPWCDPNNPRIIQFQDVSAAAFKIKSGIINTPCTYSNMSTLVGCDLFFKKEFNQHTGSFKERGARYTLLCLSEEQKRKGVIAASAGNHALALSYHGKDLGIPVTVVMPIVAPIMKVQACRQYGANVIVKGYDIGECREIALEKARDNSLLYLNGYDHPHILAGQGTMGLEIVEQVPNIDAVVIPVGGGGLIAGVALAVKSLYPNVKVIGVESEKCASYTAALKAKKPVKTRAESTLADGLAVPCVGVNAFATGSHLIDKVVTVREEWIAIAILRLVEMEKAVVEGAGATGLAALLAGQLPELKGKRVVIPLCGGNIDTTVLGRCLERGLAADGRLVKFTATVSDRPGGIAELTRLLANLGVSIKDMLHERAWIRNDIFSVEVKVLCETRDYEHFTLLKKELEKKYERIRFSLPTQIGNPI